MARETAPKPVVIEAASEPSPTPAPEKVTDKTGIHDAAPRKEIVGDYPERPYAEAISPAHREFLESKGVEVK